MKGGVILEIWKDIEGFEGKYQISTWGRVRNVVTGDHIKPYKNEKGYLKVSLHKDGVGHKKRVNRLVALAFIDNPYGLPMVNHKDGNKENNSISNLEWTTDEYNRIHARKLREGIYKC